MGRLSGHTSFNRGKRVYVRLRTGETYVDRFLERESRYVKLEEHGRVLVKDIDVMSIAKVQR